MPLRVISAALIAVTMIALLVPLLPGLPGAGLDPSWVLGLNRALAQHLGYGADIVFSYGPYSAIATQAYAPSTYYLMLWASVYLAACYAVMLVLLGRNTPWYWAVPFCVLSSAFCFGRDPVLFVYPFLLTLYVYQRIAYQKWSDRKAGWGHLLLLLLCATPLGLLPLIKGSLLFVCVPLAALCFAALLVSRRFIESLLVLLGAIASTLIFWCFAGQPFGNLPSFAWSTLLIARGYTGAMAIAGSPMDFWWFSAGALPILCVVIFRREQWLARVTLASGFLLVAFLGFKAGFVRHDGHALCAAATIILLAAALSFAGNRRYILPAMAIAVACEGILSIHYLPGPATPLRNIASVYTHFYDGLASRMRGDSGLLEGYHQSMTRISGQTRLPVLQGTSDIYPTNISYLIASGNTWNPRPVFQSYSAYSPSLQKLNVQHLSGPGSPQNIFFQVQPIDNRLPTFEDGASWPALLTRYAPVAYLNGFLVLKRLSAVHPDRSSQLREVSSANYRLGELIKLPAHTQGFLFGKITLKTNLLGELVSTVFKLPALEITVKLVNGKKISYRFIPGIAESPFLISPLVQDTTQFGLLYGDATELRDQDVAAIRVSVANGASTRYWKPTFALTAFSLDRSPTRDIDRVLGLATPERLMQSDTVNSNDICEGAIDSINGHSPSAHRPTPIGTILIATGWLANSTTQNTIPSTVYVTLRGQSARSYYLPTVKTARPDVASHFHAAGLMNTGYQARASIASVPSGDYRLGLAYSQQGKIHSCPQWSYPVSVGSR